MSHEPIAITGYALRFPGGANSPEALWDLLREGRDAIVPIPLDRLPQRYRHASSEVPGRTASVQAGILDDIAGFDAGYFGISPREARLMDPHQRLLLELSVEALDAAATPASRLAGRPVAVFTAMGTPAYIAQMTDREIDIQTGVGTDSSVGSNRISYMLDLTGPSVTINTACSSALTAFHLACLTMHAGDAEMALVCAANLITDPRYHLVLSKSMLLAPDGRCRSFDASGSGYVRAEGAAVMVLKPLVRALEDGDPVLAVVRGTGANADGRNAGLSLPSGEAQARLLRQVYDSAGVNPVDVCYVEAHGTGTRAGDPIECGAIGAVLGAARPPGRPLLIGSIKSNIGHMETAAGLGGLAKALLALEHGTLPRSLHFETPNPEIDFAGKNMRVVTALTPIPPEDPGLIGVSSFGFGGANAHVLLQRHGLTSAPAMPGPVLSLPVTARSAPALDAAVAAMQAFLVSHPEHDAADVAYTALRRRDLHPHRAVVVADGRAGLLAGLAALAGGTEEGATAKAVATRRGRTAFLFTGNGPQWFAMGRELLLESCAFRARFHEVEDCFQAQAKFSLLAELQRDEADSRIARTEVAQPLLFALQLALVAHLAHLGLVPATVMGHSVGEVAAACVAGILDLPAAVRVIHERSRWQETTAGTGGMAAVGLSAADAAAWLERHAPDVVVAAANGPHSATLAGSSAALDALQDLADEAGLFFRRLRLDYAFHSPAMDPIRAPLLDSLHGLAPGPGTLPFVSSVTGGQLEGAALDSEYWWRNVRDRVRFDEAVQALLDDGCDTFIEIGPHPALSGYVKEALDAAPRPGLVLKTLRRRTPERLALNGLLARCLAEGVPVDLAALSPCGTPVRLPAYPWQHERHWATGLLAEGDERHPLLGAPLSSGIAHWENDLSLRSHPALADHSFAGEPLLPTTAYVELIRAAAEELYGSAAADIHDLDIHAMLIVPEDRPVRIAVSVQPDGGFSIRSRPADEPQLPWTLHASGRVAPVDAAAAGHAPMRFTVEGPLTPGERFYAGLDPRGVTYGPGFRLLHRLYAATDADGAAWSVGELLPRDVRATEDWHPAVMDTVLQLPLHSMAAEPGAGAFLPSRVRRVRILQGTAAATRAAMRVTRQTRQVVEAEMLLLDPDGRVLVRLDGYKARRAGSGREARPQGQLHLYRWTLLHPRDALPPVLPADLASFAAVGDTSPELDALCRAMAAEALLALDPDTVDPKTGALPDLDGMAVGGEIDGAMLPFARRLHALARQATDPALSAWRQAFAAAPGAFLDLELAWAVGPALTGVLQGVTDPQDMLQDVRPLLTRALEGGALAAGSRHATAAAVRGAVAAWPQDCRLRVLELDAGRSAVTAAVLPLLPPARCTVVLADPDPAVLEVMRDRFPGQQVSVASVDSSVPADLSKVAGPFDLILANDTLQQAPDLPAILAALRRQLSRNGLLLLDVREASPFAELVFGSQRGMTWIDPAAWPELLQEAGFAEIAATGPLWIARNPAVLPEPAGLGGAGQADEAIPRRILIAAEAGRDAEAVVLVAALENLGQSVRRATYPCGWDETLLTDVDEVLFLTPAAVEGVPVGLCAPLLELVPALLGMAAPPRLTMVTADAFAAPGEGTPIDPAQALFWGFGRTLGNEAPVLRCRRIDLHAGAAGRLAALVAGADPGEDELLLTPNAAHAHRLHFLDWVEDAETPAHPTPEHALSVAAQGSLQAMTWHRVHPRAPDAGEVQVAVRASGLNFKDVLLVMGALPPELLKQGPIGPAIGIECAGVVTAVGTGVAGFAPGDAVAVFGPGTFATTVTVDARWVVTLTAGMGFADGATLPAAFATAWYALHDLARLRRCETVLIHGGAGGVGLAAIQIAHARGATVIATAGTPAKRAVLRRIGVTHVLDSRSLAFADEARRLTGGAGVDVALNALSGEAMLATMGTLRPFGRFLEIGKRDLIDNRKIGLRQMIDNISYFAIDLDQLFTHQPRTLSRLLRDVMDQMSSGTLHPLPREVYPPTRVVEAFRHMQASRHIGKLVIVHDPAQAPTVRTRPAQGSVRFDAEGTLLVTGGTRGFGLAVAAWLVERGAQCLLLASRSGTLPPESEATVAAMRAAGTRVEVMVVDAGCEVSVRAMLDGMAPAGLAPLTGVFHAAVGYADGLAAGLPSSSMELVVGPKARGAWLLHRLTRDAALRHFVMFSSIAATVGSEGQAAYAGANLYLNALAEWRRAEGRPALAVNWGAIRETGAVARDQALRDRMVSGSGLDLLAVADALSALEDAMVSELPQIGIGGLPMRAIRDWAATSPTFRLAPIIAATASASSDVLTGRPGSDGPRRRPRPSGWRGFAS